MDTQKKAASKSPRWAALTLGGVACAALTVATVWYGVTYNGGKLVYPIHSYAFAPTDIPTRSCTTSKRRTSASLR